MRHNLTRLAVAGAALVAVAVRAADGAPLCDSRLANGGHPLRADATAASLRLQGSASALRVEVCQSTVAAVLSALSDYKVTYRSSIALNQVHDGTYAGSLGQVIARVLDGYSYVIKHDSSHLDITIYGKKGELAVAAPIVTQVSQSSERLPHQVSRNH
jgi:hypothetical protein